MSSFHPIFIGWRHLGCRQTDLGRRRRLVQLRRDDGSGAVVEPAGAAQEIDVVGNEAVALFYQPCPYALTISARGIGVEQRAVAGLKRERGLLDEMEEPPVALARQRPQDGP